MYIFTIIHYRSGTGYRIVHFLTLFQSHAHAWPAHAVYLKSIRYSFTFEKGFAKGKTVNFRQ